MARSQRGKLTPKKPTNFKVNLSETLSFSDAPPPRLPSTSGGNKRGKLGTSSGRGKSAKFFTNQVKKFSVTPEQSSFNAVNLNNINTRKVGKSFVFSTKNATLPVQPQFGTRTNSKGGTDFSINLSERLKFTDEISGRLTIPQKTSAPPSPPTPQPDILEAIFDFFRNFGGSSNPTAPPASQFTIIEAPPVVLPPINADGDQVLFPEFDPSSSISGGGSTDGTDDGKGFLDALTEKPENLVLGGTAIIALIAGLR